MTEIFQVGDRVQIRQSTGEYVARPFLVKAVESNGARLIVQDYAHPIPGERTGQFGETAAWCRMFQWQ
jgi:hypothetical protein